MARTRRGRDREYYRRLAADTSKRARTWRKRDEDAAQAARDAFRKYHGERLSWRSLVQALES